MNLDDISENFSVLDDWEDRYRYVIELGKGLPPLPDQARLDANKVRGCASQVWLVSALTTEDGVLRFRIAGDSDAHIVKGLVAIVIALYSGKTPREVLGVDALSQFERLGLKEHLTPQRSNGLVSMVNRIRADAEQALSQPVGVSDGR